eukprot:NODE_601_length_6216_cov_0.086644.p1 type:complete len:465 gc:universal NODE_601_length_6216_cov_0.086644:2500-3894(+)
MSQLGKHSMRLGKELLSNSEAQWIKMSRITYENNNKHHSWEMVERKHSKSSVSNVDAIVIAPILVGDGPNRTVLTLQYRPPIDKISVEFPSGLTDLHEFAETTALRELKEETGYVGKVVGVSPVLSSDPGLTNSVFQIVTVQVDLNSEINKHPVQNLQGDESIQLKVVELDQLLLTLNELSASSCIDGKLYHFAMGLHNFSTPQLNMDQLNSFKNHGYAVVPNVLSASECDILLSHSKGLCVDFDSSDSSVFETNENLHTKDKYFLDSHDKISYFLEKDGSTVNKIGHALHFLDPLFKLISDKAVVSNICAQIGMVDPHIMQSMVIFKQPKIGGEVGPHQDGTFLISEKLIAFWFALEDATIENGCLQISEGSHKLPIATFFESDGSTTKFNRIQEDPVDLKYKPVVVKKGSLVLLHGNTYHKSMQNASENSRVAYTFHVADLEKEWNPKNWIKKSHTSYRLNQ